MTLETAPKPVAAAEPIIQLSDTWRVRDDGEQWVLQQLAGKPGSEHWHAQSFWTYRYWLLRAIAEAGISVTEGGPAKIRALPATHRSRGLPTTFDVDAFVRAVDEGKLKP